MCPDMGSPRVEKAGHGVAVPAAGDRSSLTLPVDRTPFQMQKKQTSQTKRRQSARSHFREPGLSIPEDRLSTLRLWEKRTRGQGLGATWQQSHHGQSPGFCFWHHDKIKCKMLILIPALGRLSLRYAWAT